MNRGRNRSQARTGGYTIVETIIFLAVSSVLFVSAMLLISGRQNKAQFVNAVRDFESNLIDIANDVANGYYQSRGNLECFAPGTNAPSPPGPGAPDILGTNKQCILLGRAIKLYGGSTPSPQAYDVYSVAGRTKIDSGSLNSPDVSNLLEAKPTLITANSTKDIGKKVGYGAEFQCVRIGANCLNSNTAIAFFTDLSGGGVRSITADKPGKGIRVGVYSYSSINSSSSEGDLVTAIANTGSPVGEQITICIKSGGTNQYGLIKLGAEGSSGLTITSEISETPCT